MLYSLQTVLIIMSLPLDLSLALQLILITWPAFLQLSSVYDYLVRRPRLLFKAKRFKLSHYNVFLDLQCICVTNNFRASETEDTCSNHRNFVPPRLCSSHYWAHSDHRPLFSCFSVILVMLGRKFYIWFLLIYFDYSSLYTNLKMTFKYENMDYSMYQVYTFPS